MDNFKEDQIPEGQTENKSACAAVKEAAERITRAKFTVRVDTAAKENGVYMILLIIVMAGVLGMSLGGKNMHIAAVTAVSVASGLAVVAAIATAVYFKRKGGVCGGGVYVRDGDKEYCLTVSGDRAVLFAVDTVYVVEGAKMYSLDKKGYIDWLDGESAGLTSVLAAGEDDVVYDKELKCYAVGNPKGGEHRVFLSAAGDIEEIVSDVPRETDVIDKTGARKLTFTTYIKSFEAGECEWETPPFVIEAFKAHGIELPVLPDSLEENNERL